MRRFIAVRLVLVYLSLILRVTGKGKFVVTLRPSARPRLGRVLRRDGVIS